MKYEQIDEGETTVGADTVPLSSSSIPCDRVRVLAPTTKHAAGAVNGDTILVGRAGTGNQKRVLDPADHTGFTIDCSDVNELEATGYNAGDVIVWIAERNTRAGLDKIFS